MVTDSEQSREKSLESRLIIRSGPRLSQISYIHILRNELGDPWLKDASR